MMLNGVFMMNVSAANIKCTVSDCHKGCVLTVSLTCVGEGWSDTQ